jgi:phage tail-like protein
MFAGLPAVFRNRDETRDLARLLNVLAAFFFTGRTTDGHVPGLEQLPDPSLEQYLDEIPAIFSPMGAHSRFLPWLASWLSFTPHALFPTESLRRIVGGIVPLYGLRGTRNYLVRLLELCFGDELARIDVEDRPSVGFTIGQSVLGVDTRLAVRRPFCFKVAVEWSEARTEPMTADAAEALQHRLRAVIDFAKPAHTTYELEWRTQPRARHRRDR